MYVTVSRVCVCVDYNTPITCNIVNSLILPPPSPPPTRSTTPNLRRSVPQQHFRTVTGTLWLTCHVHVAVSVAQDGIRFPVWHTIAFAGTDIRATRM